MLCPIVGRIGIIFHRLVLGVSYYFLQISVERGLADAYHRRLILRRSGLGDFLVRYADSAVSVKIHIGFFLADA